LGKLEFLDQVLCGGAQVNQEVAVGNRVEISQAGDRLFGTSKT